MKADEKLVQIRLKYAHTNLIKYFAYETLVARSVLGDVGFYTEQWPPNHRMPVKIDGVIMNLLRPSIRTLLLYFSRVSYRRDLISCTTEWFNKLNRIVVSVGKMKRFSMLIFSIQSDSEWKRTMQILGEKNGAANAFHSVQQCGLALQMRPECGK